MCLGEFLPAHLNGVRIQNRETRVRQFGRREYFGENEFGMAIGRDGRGQQQYQNT
jgi:hypothetical protein